MHERNANEYTVGQVQYIEDAIENRLHCGSRCARIQWQTAWTGGGTHLLFLRDGRQGVEAQFLGSALGGGQKRLGSSDQSFRGPGLYRVVLFGSASATGVEALTVLAHRFAGMPGHSIEKVERRDLGALGRLLVALDNHLDEQRAFL